MIASKFSLKLDGRKSTFNGFDLGLVFWKNLNAKVFLGKLSFSLGSFLSSCRMYSVRVMLRVVLGSGLVRFYRSLVGYEKPS